MARKMVLVAADGSSPVLTEVPANDEAQLQKRLTENPDLIPIEEFGWAGPLMVVGRETTLPSGAVDLIGVARSGEILVAEFKTGPQNPDFRHALAQAVDYGADIWQMTVEEFETAVAVRYFAGSHCPAGSPTKGCGTLADAADQTWGGDWSDEERSQFPERVASALAKGTIHYAVVAQRFTPAMERTAAYLNATTTEASYYLVELIRFSNGVVDAFEARTVLKPERTKPQRSSAGPLLDRETFLSIEGDETRRHELDAFFEFLSGMGFVMYWGTTGAAIKLPASASAGPLSVGWVHPSGVTGWMGLTQLALGYDLGSAAQRPALMPALDSYVASLALIDGGKPAKAKNLAAVVFDADAEATHGPEIKDLLAELMKVSATG